MQISARHKQLAAEIEETVRPLDQKDRQLNGLIADISDATNKVYRIAAFMEDRRYWAQLFSELRDALADAEETIAPQGGAVGVWIESIDAGDFPTTFEALAFEDEEDDTTAAQPASPFMGMTPEMMMAYGMMPPGMMGEGGAMANPYGAMGGGMDPYSMMAQPEQEDVENGISRVSLSLRAINRAKLGASANTELAHTVLESLQNREMFSAEETELADGKLRVPAEDLTFQFDVRLTLAKPLMFVEE